MSWPTPGPATWSPTQTWNDFWLNEGFTVYFERRIMEALKGRDYSEMLAQLGRQDLTDEIARLPERDTHLHLDLEGRDADDGMSDVAYEKGYLFLRMLEEEFGRNRWDAFLKDYFDRHAFQTMSTDGFVEDLKRYLVEDPAKLAELQVDAWIFGPGVPDNAPEISSPAFVNVEKQVAAFLGGGSAKSLKTKDWSSHEWQHFLRSLPAPLNQAQMADLDRVYGFTVTGNSEELSLWLQLAIRSDYEPAEQSLEDFLTEMGRRKFLRPLYETLALTPEGKARAQRIYREARPGYHPVAQLTLDGILGAPAGD